MSTPRNDLRETAWLSLTAAVVVSLLDATLIQIKKELFTGGFLAEDTLTSWPDRLAFAIGSLLSDWALTAFIVVAALAIGRRLRLATAARWVLAFGAAVLPFAGVLFFQYELARYLGDAFDLGLMFDLVGRRPSEFFAVAASHLAAPVALAAAACAGLLGVTWIVHRLSQRRGGSTTGDEGHQRSGWRMFLLSFGMLLVALVMTAAMRTSSAALENGFKRKPSSDLLGMLTEWATDVDRDGYGLLARPADPNMWDAKIHPFALDLPGNGIDEDGVGGDLPAGSASALLDAQPPKFLQMPDVLVVMLETFRHDAIGRTVNGKPVTPVLDRLAKRGLSVDRAYSHNGYTTQSQYHFFSGVLPVVDLGTTLVDDFNHNGYDTAYFSAQDESFGSGLPSTGFERADMFYDARQDRDKRYTTFSTPGSLGVSSATLLMRIQAFLDARERTRPLFLYVNLYDTHYPYYHREMKPLVSDVRLRESDIRPENQGRLREAYYNAAANTDAAVGALLERLSGHLGREPGVLVLADHGESLFDEGFLGHGYALNDAQTRIPLIVAGLSAVVPIPAGQADLRGVMRDALAGDRDPTAAPRTAPRQGDALFQYLGNLHRPKQIGFVVESGRVLYDFRSTRVRMPGGDWRDPQTLDDRERPLFLELVRFWERLRLASRRQG